MRSLPVRRSNGSSGTSSPRDNGPRGLADIVLREAESRLSETIEGTMRCAQNRARLGLPLYERLGRLEAALAQAM
ncbi:hypothetical protein [Streptomyces sp. NPDC008121]|uniref:hypothetical protein n=1 Tax=Streptomyces sp. NPDC008121 TaxID=3364809 RepID=UPI0036E18F45